MNLQEQLADAMQGKVVVLGIGNPSRGDDAAGSRVVQRISSAAGVSAIDAQEVPENYLRYVEDQGPNTIVFVDAVELNSAPGSVALLDDQRTVDYWPSTHRVPLSLLVDYLKRTTGARIFLIAIQPRETDFLQPMSAEVSSSVERIVALLNDVLATRNGSADIESTDFSRGKVPA